MDQVTPSPIYVKYPDMGPNIYRSNAKPGGSFVDILYWAKGLINHLQVTGINLSSVAVFGVFYGNRMTQPGLGMLESFFKLGILWFLGWLSFINIFYGWYLWYCLWHWGSHIRLNTKPKFCGDEEWKGLLLTLSSIVVVWKNVYPAVN